MTTYINSRRRGSFRKKRRFTKKRKRTSRTRAMRGGTVINYSSDCKYDGDVIDENKRHGNGKMTWHDGRIYEGEWKDDKANGKGKFSWHDGDIYEGEWKDDKANGKGKFSWPDGRIYEGDFIDNRQHGKGTMTWANGDKYEGEWKDDMSNGQGKQTYHNGDIYEGEWKDNIMNGKGKLVKYNGGIYEGDFSNGRKEGTGKYKSVKPDSTITYEGEFKNDKFSGHGKYIFQTSDDPPYVEEYVGMYENDLKNGVGYIYTSRKNLKRTIYGHFKDGKMISAVGKRIQEDGTIEEGEFENNKIIKGKRTGPNNAYTYEGTFDTNGNPLKGTMTVYNEPVNDESRSWIWTYTGRYQNGKMHGYGVMTWDNGEQQYHGMWENDKPSPGEGEYMKIQPEEAQIRTRYTNT